MTLLTQPFTGSRARAASAALAFAFAVLGGAISAHAQSGDKPDKPNKPGKPDADKPKDPAPAAGGGGLAPPGPPKPVKPGDFPGYTERDAKRDRRRLGVGDEPEDTPLPLADDDRLQWGVRLPAPTRAAAVAGTLRAFAVSDDGTVTAIDLARGEVAWTSQLTAGAAARPTLAGERLIVPLTNGDLVAVDCTSGGVRNSSRQAGPIEVPLQLVPAGDRLIAATTAGGLVAIDAKTLKVEWRATGMPGVGLLEPLLYGEHAIVADRRGRVRAIQISSGKPAWERQILGSFETPPVVVRADRAVFLLGSVTGELTALDPATGTVSWTTKGFAPFLGATVWGKDVLAAFANRRLFILDPATGKSREDRSLKETPDGAPFVVGNLLFVPCLGGRVEVLDSKLRARDPLLLGADLVPGGPRGGTLLLTTDNGDLYRWKGP